MHQWVSALDDLGRTYYYNTVTLQASWDTLHDVQQLHLASSVRTCVRIGRHRRLVRAFGAWRDAATSPHRVRTLAVVLDAWMRGRLDLHRTHSDVRTLRHCVDDLVHRLVDTARHRNDVVAQLVDARVRLAEAGLASSS
jgi:hypothetical protein